MSAHPSDLRESPPKVSVDRSGDPLQLRFQGTWRVQFGLPSRDEVESALAQNGVRSVSFDTAELAAWDSGFLTFVMKVRTFCSERAIALDSRGLPEGVRRLMAMADEVPEAQARKSAPRVSFLAAIGLATMRGLDEITAMLAFAGEAIQAFGRLVVGKAQFRRTDLTSTIYASGAQALGIVALICFLVGAILAFIGAIELKKFGADIYVANLVGSGMAREMAAMMTAIIMAGRTGAAFAAQLGTMTVNEEIDALRTLGIRPMEFLVLPRMLGLGLMMPLLTLYGMIIGILGGALVSKLFLGLSLTLYCEQLTSALRVGDIVVGLSKGMVFGVVVAFAGCLRGMQSGRSAAAVGAAATSAVVTSIVLIIGTDAVFGVVLNVLGI